MVGVAELRALGFTPQMVRRRRSNGHLRSLHRGVYSVGPIALTVRGRFRAAVLAAGTTAVLSHRSAALLWGFMRGDPGRAVHVTSLHRCREITGVRAHRSRILTPSDIARMDGIPLTSVAWTLLDLAGTMTPSMLATALHEAEVLQLFDLNDINDVLARSDGRRGTNALDAAIAAWRDEPLAREGIEEQFAALLAATDIERPRINHQVDVGPRLLQVDVLWPTHRLVVELDGGATHTTRRKFEEDRLRDEQLRLAGYQVIRFTARRLNRDPAGVLDTLRRLLPTPARGRPSPSSRCDAGRA